MKLPNKVTSYGESILPKAITVLKKLENKSMYILELYDSVKGNMNLAEFQDSLILLYALNKININEEVVYYVEGNILR